jgi:signal transduction histidine kinase
MLNPETNPAVKSNDFIAGSRNQQYDRIITELSIRQSISIPLFSEATTQATGLTESPISILSLVSDLGCQIGAIAGRELLDKLPTDPNLLLELAGIEYCHHQTMICDRYFIVNDFQAHPKLNTTAIFQSHGIRSYVGVPIITAAGDRLGVISILDFIPYKFSDALIDRLLDRDIDLLQLVSRWLASEFERKFLSQAQLDRRIGDLHDPTDLILHERNTHGFDDNIAVVEHIQHEIKDRFTSRYTSKKIYSKQDLRLNHLKNKTEIQFELLTHLAQKLRTPLTSILGMASVLQQEIYGSLSNKQKDYLGIIHSSGQQLVSIVDEITQLAIFEAEVSALASRKQQLNFESIDLEMLCKLAIYNLEPLLQQKYQQISIDLSKGNRIWLLDKDKVKQIIYYLSLSLIQGSATRHQISIELVANSTDRLQLQITTSDPHLTLLDAPFIQPSTGKETRESEEFTPNKKRSILVSSQSIDNDMGQDLRVSLGLSLSHTLAAIHGGNIELSSNQRGYRVTLSSQ